YWDAAGVLIPANESKLVVDNDTGIGAANITAGKFFHTVTVGATAGTPIVATSLNLTVGDDEDFVTVNKLISKDVNITIGTQVDAKAPIWTFTAAGTVGGNEVINAGLGTIAGTGFASFSDTETVGGNQTIAVGNGNGSVTVT